MAISFDRSFSIHDDAMILRGKRSSMLASNLANADTPGYKARDIDFEQMLHQVNNQSPQKRIAMSATHNAHIASTARDLDGQLMYRNPLHASLDGNTVDSQIEQAEFAENAMMFQASFNFLNSKVKGLMKALKGE